MDDAARLPRLPDAFERWFAARGWSPRAHQLEMLDAAEKGEDALLMTVDFAEHPDYCAWLAARVAADFAV